MAAPSIHMRIRGAPVRMTAEGVTEDAPSPKRKVVLEDTSDGAGLGKKRKQIAKARHAVQSQGKGGMKVSRGKTRSEQKKVKVGKGFGKATGGLNYDRRPAADVACACGAGKPYGQCCSPLHDGTEQAVASAAQ